MTKKELNKFIKDNKTDLMKEADLIVFEELFKIISDLGIELTEQEETIEFFANRVKKVIHKDTTTVLIDNVEVLAFEKPIFKVNDDKGIDVKVKMTRLS